MIIYVIQNIYFDNKLTKILGIKRNNSKKAFTPAMAIYILNHKLKQL